MNILITGGCGFIGSNFVRFLAHVRPAWKIVNYDKLTYAGNLENLADLAPGARYSFVRGDVCNRELVEHVLRAHEISAVVHLAAESHVDRSILDPHVFLSTNVLGTQVLLEAALRAQVSKFVQVSTDEVYGSLGETGAFTETSPLCPSSPYSASKAGADLLALSFYRTYGLPVSVTRCSNNYGRFQFPEKLIPLMIIQALGDQPLPVYGDGGNVRDWLHVEDHCEALLAVLERGRAGEIYNVGGEAERRNIDLVKQILAILGKPERLIKFVEDRPGHDRRYAIHAGKIGAELGWSPRRRLEEGLRETAGFYVDNPGWWRRVMSGEYRSYYESQVRGRLMGAGGSPT
ncbi:MAG: dTDP-glucose 4,6-dehydratase [Deltaproteobacteria bacterium]|nr:dTDP-glucose 4,6-dehydratase [Deltaproteobacteria bacterium]